MCEKNPAHFFCQQQKIHYTTHIHLYFEHFLNFAVEVIWYCIVLQGSGQWSGQEPHCEAFSIAAIIILTIVSLVFLAVSSVCPVCCLHHARKIKVVLFMKFGISFGQRLEMHRKLYDVYVMYDQDNDGLFVENELISMLEENKLKVPNMECPTLGQDQFSSLEAMFNKSCSPLIVLSQNFLKSRWNLYDLNQAVVAEFQHKKFKVVFLRKNWKFRENTRKSKTFLEAGHNR